MPRIYLSAKIAVSTTDTASSIRVAEVNLYARYNWLQPNLVGAPGYSRSCGTSKILWEARFTRLECGYSCSYTNSIIKFYLPAYPTTIWSTSKRAWLHSRREGGWCWFWWWFRWRFLRWPRISISSVRPCRTLILSNNFGLEKEKLMKHPRKTQLPWIITKFSITTTLLVAAGIHGKNTTAEKVPERELVTLAALDGIDFISDYPVSNCTDQGQAFYEVHDASFKQIGWTRMRGIRDDIIRIGCCRQDRPQRLRLLCTNPSTIANDMYVYTETNCVLFPISPEEPRVLLPSISTFWNLSSHSPSTSPLGLSLMLWVSVVWFPRNNF